MWILVRKCLSRIPKYSIQRTLITGKPRVRFAPSPTGYIHLGGLRTALYNYLLAKSHKGDFILRIEDTDQTRKVEGAVEALINDLEWAGIQYDEGPGKGGPFGPYIQSERLRIYQDQVDKLLKNGSAYHCFCSENRLQSLRIEAANNNTVFRNYDNACRELTVEEVKQKLKSGISHCIRFKLSADVQTFEDIVYGSKEIPLDEGDPVVMKGDGYPTYHFANVVDDHLMQITHVLRGAEWITSTPKHLMLYRAFGWSPPQFCHLPLILNPDSTKLSKRQNDIRVEDYRKKGIYPLALVNYVVMAGGGFDRVRGAGIRIRTMDELAKEFQLHKLSTHPGRLNPDLLEECNRLEYKQHLSSDKIAITIAKLQHLLKQTYPNEKLSIADEYVKDILIWSTSRVTKMEDLIGKDYAFLWILPEQPILQIGKDILEKLINNLEEVENFQLDSLKKILKIFAKENNIKFPLLMKTLRSILSNTKEGPAVAEVMDLLGKHQSLERIKSAIK